MIPHKLRLKNFLSYRDGLEPLDFRGMHLACLVGQNGHGKSALLDAVTWALWGKARGSSDDDLMHAGESEMEVEFEFALAETRYNVVRKRLKRGKTGRSMLEFAVWDETREGWTPLTESTIRATQARINRVLRMDYETFVHSAFLKQGEADAFTRKTPRERKDILARILNLAEYDAYAERAKERAKEMKAQAQVLEEGLRQIEEELARKSEYEEQVRSATVAETQARLAMEKAENELTAARSEVQALEAKLTAQEELAARLEEDLRDHEQTKSQWDAAQRRLQQIETRLEEREIVESQYQALQTARAEEARWSKALQGRRPLENQLRRLQQEIADAEHEIRRQLALAERDLAEAEKRASTLDAFTAKAEETRRLLAEMEALQSENQVRQERLSVVRLEIEHWQREKTRIKEEGKALRGRLDMLRSGETEHCPVCKKPLGADGREHLEVEYESQLAELREHLRAASAKLKELEQEEQTLLQTLQVDRKHLQRLKSLQRQEAEIEHALKDAKEAAERLPELRRSVGNLKQRLEQGDFASEVRVRLYEIEQKLTELVYDETAHEQARATVSDLQHMEKAYFALQEALQQVDSARDHVRQLKTRWEQEEARLADDRERLRLLEEETARLPSVRIKLREKQEEHERARQSWEQAHSALIAAKQRLQACETLENTRKERLAAMTKVKTQLARYQYLQEAFGPKGVQAMIIEAALPELETEANRLLARLSDGRMNVRLETQRELKSGGVRETLDIIISDELGSRPYELYSGGEAFRANLALRIALSRLLARRAGAALQTLFIDEGFGTQDAQGRENLVEAIHMIKDEFALLLVITHIDELKEHFPVRIQVVKEDGVGSRYWVN
ncbi:MAG: SMC family ATPase [Chloroflexi bacterium]|nr:SMC family ATPase [Chloroflexota bacterium]